MVNLYVLFCFLSPLFTRFKLNQTEVAVIPLSILSRKKRAESFIFFGFFFLSFECKCWLLFQAVFSVAGCNSNFRLWSVILLSERGKDKKAFSVSVFMVDHWIPSICPIQAGEKETPQHFSSNSFAICYEYSLFLGSRGTNLYSSLTCWRSYNSNH